LEIAGPLSEAAVVNVGPRLTGADQPVRGGPAAVDDVRTPNERRIAPATRRLR
jgi:hypothetical protein